MSKVRMFAFTLVVFALMGCKSLFQDDTELPTTTESKPKPNILYAWTGEFSKENLQKTIEEYRQNYTPVIFGETASASAVFFETDFDIAEFSVSRVSKVDGKDIDAEMEGYIDLHIEQKRDGRRITIETDWWHKSNGWTKNYPVWSYLVYVKDTAGAEHYYYFRVHYTVATDSTDS